MKIHKLIYFLLAGSFALTSCEDFLETESPSQQTSQVVYENEGMARSAIMGVYSQLSGTYVYGQKMSVNWQGVSDIELASGYDDDPSLEKSSDTGAANYWSDWYNHTVKWEHLFKMAELASTAVEGLRNSSKLETSATLRHFLGEALTLRSIAYFELARRWGDIPFKESTASSDLSNVYMGKTSRDSIYTCIIKDMQEAIEYLPWMGQGEYNAERITKGFAKGMLARMALTAGGWSVRDGNQFPDDSNVEHYPNVEGNPGMAEMNGYYVGRPKNWRDFYEIAEKECAELIGDPENPHALDPDYGNIWKTVCALGYSACNENMFEIANGVGYTGDIGSLMGRPQSSNIGYGSQGFGSTYVCTNGYYFYSFDPDDTRREYACYWPNYEKDSKVGYNREKMRNNIMSVNLGKWSFHWTSDAYKALVATASGRTSTGINWILMRYSDILLMFAEARYMLDKGVDAVDATAGLSASQALEMVRARAFGAGSPKVTDYDKNDFLEAIVNERAWEFGGEGIRKLDLVRWGLLDSKIEDMKEAMVLMMDGQHPVKIFDKVYQPGDFPQKLYYKYEDNKQFIDFSTANFYVNRAANPDASVYEEIGWFPNDYWTKETETDAANLINNSVKVLVCASGLRANYDYSDLFSKLKWGTQIQERMNTTINKIGNGVCNYRHFFTIYYEDIYESNGYLSNSYGY